MFRKNLVTLNFFPETLPPGRARSIALKSGARSGGDLRH